MTPTPKVRWVERPYPGFANEPHRYRVLQQWWAELEYEQNVTTGLMHLYSTKGEWRDVPLEEEEEHG